ncbi:hypothetical protein GRI39_12125 [Altererythrobacter indicus]|uniref:Lipoprotein n=1 Tax=Altericroceibacterium indicum TaxID=374177 RepID=A0A845A8T2_9SPHN|nr:hypothetical protein [Altericroceibacterium indicum]MXP26782.1 hypothetical protein [Altericroceibacterium indicum]
MTKRNIRFMLPLALPLMMLGACVPQVTPPAPTPAAPTPAPAPAPTPKPQPTYDNWMDAPQTPGDWSYQNSGTTSEARFGETPARPVFAMRCDKGVGIVSLIRIARTSRKAEMQVLTETANRTFPTSYSGDGVAAKLPANDRFLDAMAFSKGRFAIKVSGANTLYVPAWPEVTRIIEDCR